MKTTEEEPNIFSLQNPSIPPDIQAEAVRISFHERKLSFSKKMHKFEEIDVLNKDGSDDYNQTGKIELVQDKDQQPAQDRVKIQEKEEAESLIGAVEVSIINKFGQGGPSQSQLHGNSRNKQIQLTPSFPYATSTIAAQSEKTDEAIIPLQVSSHGNSSPIISPAEDGSPSYKVSQDHQQQPS